MKDLLLEILSSTPDSVIKEAVLRVVRKEFDVRIESITDLIRQELSDVVSSVVSEKPSGDFEIKFPLPGNEFRKASLYYKGSLIQEFVYIKPGTFLMGSPPDEVDRSSNETQHEVTLTRGYWLADTACTQSLWQAVMGDNPSQFNDDPTLPVETVSWNDVQTFLDRLNAQVPGLDAGLPSEAQWEYACRAGTTTPFSFGENITPEQVNYDGNRPYADGKKGVYRQRTVPVKSLPPNPWGLYEMHGNVWEWCADWFGDYPPGPQIDPSGPSEGAGRVLRGGTLDDAGRYCRAAYRAWGVLGYRSSVTGFRIMLSS